MGVNRRTISPAVGADSYAVAKKVLQSRVLACIRDATPPFRKARDVRSQPEGRWDFLHDGRGTAIMDTVR